MIGERLNENIPLIMFAKGEEVISPRIGYKNNRTKRKMRDYFLDKINLSEGVVRKRIENNVYVGIDTSMFKEIVDHPFANNGSSQKTGIAKKV